MAVEAEAHLLRFLEMIMTSIDQIQQSHTLLAKYSYELKPVVRGYAGRTLQVILGSNQIIEKTVTPEMKELFTGGRGFCLKLLWDSVNENTRWNDAENELVVAGGPIGGIVQYPGSGKMTAVFLSPLTNVVMDSNAGGYFGPYLKFAGFDALEVQGKAERDVIIVIDGDKGFVTIEEAPLEAVDTHVLTRQLTDMLAPDKSDKRGISIISAGQAADYAPIAGLNVSFYDPKREEVRIKQAARGGGGRVLRDKKIKAIVVRYSSIGGENNGPADAGLIKKAGQRIKKEIADFDASQNDMSGAGTPYLVEIMNRFDLLPVQNFRFGADDQYKQIMGEYWKKLFDRSRPDGCWYGCTLACAHTINHFHLKTGPYKNQIVLVDGPEYETLGGLGSNCGIFDPEMILEMNFYCDTYGIDTISMGNSVAFVMECYEYGILNKEKTGGLDLHWGNAEAVLELLHQLARGEGFGLLVGQGVHAMKKEFVEKFGADGKLLHDIGMEIKGLEISEYMTKESLAQQGGYALASKGPQHEEAWLIFADMVHKQIPTFEAKAEALHYFPIWRTWFSLHGLCKLPWNDIVPVSNKTAKEPAKFPEHVENYCWLYEGITGKAVTIDNLILQSERVYNFQRVFNVRMGYGTREYDYPPYRAVGPVTTMEYLSREERYDKEIREQIGVDPSPLSVEEKMSILRKYREDRYEQLVDTVYKRRGWNNNGIPTIEKLRELHMDLPEVIDVVRKHQ